MFDTLRIENTVLSTQDVQILSGTLTDVKVVILDNARFERNSMILDMLKNNTSVEQLHIHRMLSSIDGDSLAELLASNKTLKVLDISNNELGDFGVKCLSRGIASNSTLRTLNLHNNDFMTSECIFDAVNKGNSIEILDLSENKIHVTEPVARSLSSNRKLISLNLSSCKLHGASFDMIASGLFTNKTLLDIDLSKNHPTESCVQTLRFLLISNFTLRRINLSFNSALSSKSIDGLISVLEINKSIISFSVKGCCQEYEEKQQAIEIVFMKRLSPDCGMPWVC